MAYGVPKLPSIASEDPAMLEALHGNFGLVEHLRKCTLAKCEELVRARCERDGEKVSEGRIKTLARLEDEYLDFLIDSLNGRHQRELNVRESSRY